LGAALKVEFGSAKSARMILAVNRNEVEILRRAGFGNVAQLGTARAPVPTVAGFAERNGLLFVAGIHQADSPNLDSLRWYQAEIQPALAVLLGEAPVLHVVGYAERDIDLSAFARNPGIKLHGAVDDLTPFYNAARVFIAPTRFAAGTPYKVYETASFGLPCVTTELLAGQLGWEEELLVAPLADARAFAGQIARLYQSESLWKELRAKALARLARENGFEEFQERIEGILKEVMK
jgi:glycosyltransferase involved in cell wall biosynthesis